MLAPMTANNLVNRFLRSLLLSMSTTFVVGPPMLRPWARPSHSQIRQKPLALLAAQPGGAALLPLSAEVVRLYRPLKQGAASAGAVEPKRLQAVLAAPPS